MQTCFEATCCEYTGKDKSQCNAVCPHKNDFADWLADTGGLRFDDTPSFHQPEFDLPLYVPVIDHASRRLAHFSWPVVSLNTSRVLGMRRGDACGFGAVAETPSDLRHAFRVTPESRVIMCGIGKDHRLEPYWENRLVADAPNQLAKLEIDAAIGPNFSHFLGVPRTDNLFNRRRQLLCLDELLRAGVPIIPHLNAVMPEDWRFWRDLLAQNPSLRVVAVEFQTGNKNPVQGRKAIDNLAAIQRQINRPLHPVIVGGGQFVEHVAVRFSTFTLMDSTPFAKALRRQYFDGSAGKSRWCQGFRLLGQDVDEYLLRNVTGYSNWIRERVDVARSSVCASDE
ncbi:MAG: DUF4417 domain-containing protein [Planctomycetaceae bacterium]|nr:DUF4417 domain-containing protein [Planctomycetaceae bacterium]